MRPRLRVIALAALGAGGAAAVLRRSSRTTHAQDAPGGVLMSDVASYDRISRLVLGSLFRGIAADVTASTPAGGKVLEIGCGPGLLSVRLAEAGFDVTGLDLDPAMIERARANAARSLPAGRSEPAFVVGDVAHLPFPDGTFDRVVSTFSMHHWSDRTAGLNEIARVLTASGTALVWDLKPGALPFHPATSTHAELPPGVALSVASEMDWLWPGPFALARRLELTHR
jgi:ubiquinone/menaquinone biosynthesis C-methylase UbiE